MNEDISSMTSTIKEKDWDKEVTPKKTVSKSPEVRISPRFGGEKNKIVGGSSARKLFGQGGSEPTQKSVVGDNLRKISSSTPVEVDDDFDKEYWLNNMKENDKTKILKLQQLSDEDNEDASKVFKKESEYYKKFQADNPEFEDEPAELFDDSNLVQPLNP
ncbi:hypothetical protein C5167_029808 [Papaver somniferum]|nr:hypothetical protein C5167_029808 [Papaver somniferum]